MKFKVGDKVIFHTDDTQLKLRTERGYLGKIFTIKEPYSAEFYLVEEAAEFFKTEWLELEEIYNSPLYQAMLEKEE